jgi:hypothetical protein
MTSHPCPLIKVDWGEENFNIIFNIIGDRADRRSGFYV